MWLVYCVVEKASGLYRDVFGANVSEAVVSMRGVVTLLSISECQLVWESAIVTIWPV